MSAASSALSGTQKAALVLIQLGRERAARVLNEFQATEIEELTAEIVRMDRI